LKLAYATKHVIFLQRQSNLIGENDAYFV